MIEATSQRASPTAHHHTHDLKTCPLISTLSVPPEHYFQSFTLSLSQLCLSEPTFAFEHQQHLLSETAVTFPAMIR